MLSQRSVSKLIFVCFFALCAGFNPSFKNILNTDGSASHASITRCSLATVTSEYMRTRFGITFTLPNVVNGICPSSIFSQIQNAFGLSRYLGGSTYSRWENMVDEIVDDNEMVDVTEQFDASRHFDAESFIAGSEIIRTRIQSAIDALNAKDYETSNERFGKMTHTLQDFYSHSNWIEMNRSLPHPDLGIKTFTASQFAAPTVRTCTSCTTGSDAPCRNNCDISKGLTSGYFIFTLGILKKKPVGKCSHGGSTDTSRTKDAIGGINKDSLSSVHGYLHVVAAQTAYLATCKVLREFRSRVGDVAFGKFLNVLNRKLVFTRSFSSMDTLNSKANQPSSLMYTTILNNLRKAESFSILRQMTPLPAMDSIYKAHILSLARRKHITIDTFRPAKYGRQWFDFGQDLSQLTGGLYGLYADDEKIYIDMNPTERTELVDVFHGKRSYDNLIINVDQACSNLLLEFFSNDSIRNVQLILQNGNQSVSPSSIATNTTYYRSYRFSTLPTGPWKLVMDPSAEFMFDLHVSCAGSFRCFSRVYVDNGNPIHGGQVELQGNPIENQHALLISTCDTRPISVENMQVTMVDTIHGQTLSLPMPSMFDAQNNRWITNMTQIPSKLFRLKFSINNGAIQRLSRSSYQPSLVDVEIYQTQIDERNKILIKYHLLNYHQTSVKIRFMAKNIGTFLSIREYQMNPNEIRDEQIEYDPTQRQADIPVDMIALTVLSQLGDWNYDVISF